MAHDPHLTARQRTGLSVPPLLLRLALAIIFIWAGYTKVFGTFAVTDENRAQLVAAGVLPKGQTVPDPVIPDPVDEEPVPEPEPDLIPEEEPLPEENPASDPDPVSPVEPAPQPEDPVAEPDPVADDPTEVILVAQTQPAPQKVRKANQIALMLHAGANPEPVVAEDGTTSTPLAIVPQGLGAPPWPKYLAWAAAITELVAGGFLLIGALTRLSGLAVAGVMGVALWLTQIGPAISSGNAWLGFLPINDPYDPMNPATYTTMLYQLALLAMGLALLFSGPGMLSIDRFVMGRGRADDED
ncbi:MAG: DoxX family membrane protein [Phycisphaera sp.]|nr:MAG: DoxX family membrane protein [Phycisphaera sp.]